MFTKDQGYSLNRSNIFDRLLAENEEHLRKVYL